MFDSSLRTQFIKKYFYGLRDNTVEFCMPRGYADLFTEIDKDIDVIISPSDYELAMELFSELVSEFGGYIIERHIREKSLYMKAIFRESDGNDDCFHGVHIHAIAYITVKNSFLGRNIKYIGSRVWLEDLATIESMVEGLKVIIPAPVYELFLLLVRYQQNQKIRYLGRCHELSRMEDVRSQLDRYGLVDSLDNTLHAQIEDERLKVINSLVKKLYPLLFKQRNLSCTWRKAVSLTVFNVATIFRATGKLVFFSGPDGSGKTTANQALSSLLEKKLKIHVLNTKHLYPVSNRYSKKGQQLQAKIRGIDGSRTEELERDRGHGLVWTLRRGLGLVFLLLQVYPGYIWARYKNWKGYTVIVDTSFFDVFVKGHRPVFPLIELVATRFIPCGDAWFLLKSSPEVIVARKPELTMDEIGRYYKRLNDISKRSSCTPHVIRSDLGVNTAVVDMLNKLSVKNTA